MSKTKLTLNITIIYHTKCPEPVCFDNYVGESARWLTERIKDHNGRDHTSHVLKHSIEKLHKNVNTIDFKIIEKNFYYNKQKHKIAKALWIKDLRPTLNTQEKSIQLRLFHWLWW